MRKRRVLSLLLVLLLAFSLLPMAAMAALESYVDFQIRESNGMTGSVFYKWDNAGDWTQVTGSPDEQGNIQLAKPDTNGNHAIALKAVPDGEAQLNARGTQVFVEGQGTPIDTAALLAGTYVCTIGPEVRPQFCIEFDNNPGGPDPDFPPVDAGHVVFDITSDGGTVSYQVGTGAVTAIETSGEPPYDYAAEVTFGENDTFTVFAAPDDDYEVADVWLIRNAFDQGEAQDVEYVDLPDGWFEALVSDGGLELALDSACGYRIGVQFHVPDDSGDPSMTPVEAGHIVFDITSDGGAVSYCVGNGAVTAIETEGEPPHDYAAVVDFGDSDTFTVFAAPDDGFAVDGGLMFKMTAYEQGEPQEPVLLDLPDNWLETIVTEDGLALPVDSACGYRITIAFREVDTAENPFTDVDESAYFFEPVLWAVANGITTGTTEDTFSPDDDCTRGQIVTFLYRAAGEPEVETAENPFTDVDESAYFYKPVLWAVANGITKGAGDTTFGPDEYCTRAQIVTFLYRAAGEPAVTAAANFTDVAADAYYANAVAWAVAEGITTGTSDTAFSPDIFCTRAQAVTFLFRASAK